MTDTRCRFLELPVELRLLIYDFAVINARVITVGTAKLTGDDADVFQRQFGNKRSPFKGIPRECEPVVDGKFNSALLLDKAAVEVKPWTASPGNTTWPWTASKSLLSVNRKISREFRDRLASPPRRETSLFVNYPHGLHVLQTATPELLGQSRSVHLAGLYYPPTNDPYWTADRLRARPYLKQLVPPEYLPGDVVPDAIGQLSQLVKSSCGPDAPYPLEMLELRIYYPGHSYSAVFSESSPLAIALLNIPWGKIELLIYRGNHGIGVHLTATPLKEKKRCLGTAWGRLEDITSRHDAGTFVVDPKWPLWKADVGEFERKRGGLYVTTSNSGSS